MPTCETKTNKSAVSLPPPLVKWAQRPSLLFITICLEDCKNPKIDVKPDHLHFEGTGGPEKKDHEVTLNFLKEIDTEKSKYSVNDRAIVFALQKKEDGPYWERLLKEKTKQHWLKIDFNKWKEEDESDEEEAGGGPGGPGGQGLEQMMAQMGGLGGMGGMGGMPGMGGMGGMPGIGGMPGMGGMPGGGMGRPDLGDIDAEDDDEDDDLPDLE